MNYRSTSSELSRLSARFFPDSLHHWLGIEYIFALVFVLTFRNFPSIFHLLVSPFRLSLYILIKVYCTHNIPFTQDCDSSPICAPLPFRFPTMHPPWTLTSLTMLKPGIRAWTLWRQTYVSTTHALPRKYSTASPEASSGATSRALADLKCPLCSCPRGELLRTVVDYSLCSSTVAYTSRSEVGSANLTIN